MERWVAKIIALIGVFIIPFICTLLPVKVAAIFEKHGEKGKTLLSCLMCFGGGVFFATFILHMGPEVRNILHVALIEPYGITYPVADLIMGVGFFMVMFMEKLVLSLNQRKKQHKIAKQRQQCLQFNQPYTSVSNGVDNILSGTLNPSMALPGALLKKSEANSGINPAANSCPLKGTGECCKVCRICLIKKYI